MICANSPKSTLTRTIRVIASRSSAMRESWRKNLSRDASVVLLGSIATGKYVDVLLANFKERLRFPSDFVGRGDMSRGGLLLRCAADKTELDYISVAGAIVNGKRPPKLEPRRYPKGTAYAFQTHARIRHPYCSARSFPACHPGVARDLT